MTSTNTMTGHRRPRGRPLATLAAAGLLVVGAAACADDSNGAGIADDGVDTPAEVTFDESEATVSTEPAPDDAIAEVAAVAATGDLTDDEIAGLLWMREEEQLAHDVYTTLHDLWGVRVFENIAASEISHIEAALGLFDQFGIQDPAADNEFGTFTNPQIQSLYDELTERGSASLIDALEVGALIEEMDIDDLRARAAATDNTEIIVVYARLERGSRNHLRAFTSQLEARDVTYEPTVLDPEAYDAIVSTAMERGRDA